VIHTICAEMTAKVQAVLEDMSSLVDSPATGKNSPESHELAVFLRQCCCEHLQAVAVSATQHLAQLRQSRGTVHSETLVDQALFLGGVCQSLAAGAADLLLRLPGGPAGAGQQKLEQGAREKLEECHEAAYALWVEWTVAEQGSALNCTVGQPQWLAGDLESLWQEMTDADSMGGEGGTTHAPAHCSTCASMFLHSLCREVNRIGGTGIDHRVVQMLHAAALSCVSTAYHKVAIDTLHPSEVQKVALQCTFDLRFLLLVLKGYHQKLPGHKALPAGFGPLLDTLRRPVDPIDMEAYDELIDEAVVAAYLRNALLLQPLAACNEAELKKLQRPSASSAKEPNILRLASSGGRFPLLATTTVFPLPPSLAKLDTTPRVDVLGAANPQKEQPVMDATTPTQSPSGMGFFRSVTNMF